MARSGGHQRQTSHDTTALPSLLWPSACGPDQRKGARLSPESSADLDLVPVVQALSGHESQRERFVATVLTEPCMDPAVITFRADVVSNLLEDTGLCARLMALLPQLSALVRERQRPIFGYQWTPEQIVQRLGELEMYVDAAVGLAAALEPARLQAPALQALQASISALVESPEFEALRTELPVLRAQLDKVQSVTIGVNLSRDLRPESAAILSVDAEKIEGRGGLLKRLLGSESAKRGITPLRRDGQSSFRSFFPPMEPGRYGQENPFVQDLQRLLERVTAPVGEAIERYLWAHTRQFATLEAELSLMLNAVALIERLRSAGLPMCRPEIAPAGERVCHLEASYNVSLALRTTAATTSLKDEAIITNPITFDREHGRVWILTGPNRGGKTTYTRAIGLAQLLFQAGLYVPARSARISPVDALYTHFPRTETTTPGEGRLDEEALRLARIFHEATPHSLILLNEVLSGTSTLEALALAHDAVRGLRLLGARAIYVTHLHELARRADEINGSTCGDSMVGSLVAEVDPGQGDGAIGHQRTFRIRPSPPLGISYASEIAEQHGISYPQLLRLLQERGLITEREAREA